MGRLTALGQEFTRIRLLRQDDPIEEFTCGSSAIDAWLHLHARRAMKESTARVYVLSNLEGSLCGFYSLSTFSVARTQLKAAGDRALTFVGVTSTYAVRAYGALRLFLTWTVLSREGVKTGMVFRFLHLPVAILGSVKKQLEREARDVHTA